MSDSEARVHVTHLRTVGIPVSDQDRALEFYVDALGFEKRLDVPFGEGRRWVEVAPPGAETTIALMATPAGAPIGIDTNLRLATDDAEADHAALLSRGVDVDAEIIPYPVPMFTLRDPDGNRLIIVAQPLVR